MTAVVSPYDTAVLALSPYAFYKLNEASGTIAYDSSGNNRNGTYQGTSGTHYLQGMAPIIYGYPRSTEFYATNAGGPKVTLPSPVNIGSSTTAWVSDLTIAAWMKPDPSALTQLGVALEINGYYFGTSGGSSGTTGAVPYMGGWVNGGEYFSPTATFADGNAHFLAETVHYNSSGYCDMNLYVDGALAKSAPGTRCSGGPLTGGIAARLSPSTGTYPYFGEISGVALFAKALTATQIANLYNPPPPPPPPGANYDATVLSSSPYAYYRLDETSGTVAVDSSGNGRNGTYNGTSGTHYALGQSSIVPGLSATAKFYTANPGQPKVSIPSLPFAGNGSGTWQSDFSVALWAKPDPSQLSQPNDVVSINDYYMGQASPAGGGAAGTNVYMGAYPTGNWYQSAGATFADGNAHFLAMTVHRNNLGTCDLSLYIDTVLASSAAGTACSGASSIVSSTNSGIAARTDFSSGFGGYFGEIGGVAIYNSALTSDQITALYTGAAFPPPPTPSPSPTPLPGVYDANVLALSPYAYYRLDEGSGTVAKDSSGNGHDGTYQGTPGTHYLLGQSSIVPGLSSSLKTYGVNPGYPKVKLPSVPFAMGGGVWQSDFSVSLWIKPDPSQLAQAAAGAEINDYYVGEGGANGSATANAYMGVMPVNNWWSSSTIYADGNAHMATLTVHQNTSGTCDLVYYVDAVIVQNPTGTACSGNSSMQTATNAGIAGRVSASGGAGPFFGEIGGVALWSRPLTSAEVGNLYSGTPAHR